MKKYILTTTLVMLGVLVLAMPTLAATTVSLSPSSISVDPGQSFNISIALNPQGTNNYAEKVVLNYPADILQVNSFTLNNTWMALTQPGYDLIDNTNGVLIKSAGYTGGLSTVTTFGTVSFYAKKTGNGTITIGNNSLAFEISSQSVLSGTPTSFTITAPAITVPKSTTPTQNPVTTPSIKTPTKNKPANNVIPIKQLPKHSSTTTTTQAETLATASPTATIGDFLTLNTLVEILVVIIILALIYFFIQRKRKK